MWRKAEAARAKAAKARAKANRKGKESVSSLSDSDGDRDSDSESESYADSVIESSSNESGDDDYEGPKLSNAAEWLIDYTLSNAAFQQFDNSVTAESLRRVPVGDRRDLHDDITIFVIFLEHSWQSPLVSSATLSKKRKTR